MRRHWSVTGPVSVISMLDSKTFPLLLPERCTKALHPPACFVVLTQVTDTGLAISLLTLRYARDLTSNNIIRQSTFCAVSMNRQPFISRSTKRCLKLSRKL